MSISEASKSGSAQAKPCCAPSAPPRERAVEELSARARSGARSAPATHRISLAGGAFLMGTDNPEAFAQDGEGPVRPVTLSPFAIDKYPVTNQRFGEFIEASGYNTEAERFGWSFVFWAHISKKRFAQIVQDTVAGAPWWCKVPGAYWNAPEGPGSNVASRGNHPVVHVSWNDAQAFCRWAGLRLPSEAEWEYAARGGLEQKLYPWGDKLRPGGEHQCNIWQGEFPTLDTGDDGFAGTCPVEAFPPNGYGIYSLAGNTWDWCSDWFGTEHEKQANLDPAGPVAGSARVIKGGSFLCHKSYCNRYRVAARSSSTPDSSSSNVSFRCAVGDNSIA